MNNQNQEAIDIYIHMMKHNEDLNKEFFINKFMPRNAEEMKEADIKISIELEALELWGIMNKMKNNKDISIRLLNKIKKILKDLVIIKHL